MKRHLLAATLALTLFAGVGATLGTAPARADDHRCNAPMSDWQPREALQQKLEGQGWEIRRIKTEDGCYEVYAIDDKGDRAEAYVDPATLEIVRKKIDD